jgi:hypothetical protein
MRDHAAHGGWTAGQLKRIGTARQWSHVTRKIVVRVRWPVSVAQILAFNAKRLQNQSFEAFYAFLSTRLNQLGATASLPLTGETGCRA